MSNSEIVTISATSLLVAATTIGAMVYAKQSKVKNAVHSVKFAPETDNSSAIYRNGYPQENCYNIDELLQCPPEGVKTLYEVTEYAASKFGNRNALGWRNLIKTHSEEKEITKQVGGKEVVEKKVWTYAENGPYQWITYNEFHNRVLKFGSAMLAPEIGLEPNGRLGIFANTCPEWLITLHGSVSQSIEVVTVYANLGAEGLKHAIHEGELTVLVSSTELLPIIEEIANDSPTLKKIIVLDKIESSQAQNFQEKTNLTVIPFTEVLEIGGKHNAEAHPPKPEDVMMIMYTSGTTGVPKGVVLTHANILGTIGSGLVLANIQPTDIYICFLPLAHVLELVIENALLLAGAQLGYANPRTLVDSAVRNCKGDLRELSPTLMCGVPAIWERIRKGAYDKLKEAPPMTQKIFNQAFKLKKKAVAMGIYSVPGLDLVFSKLKNLTGGRLRLIVSGGAPIAEETQTFLRVCFSVNCLQGYGLTESCGLLTLIPVDSPIVGRVGGPVPSVELKLVDIPEMNYTHKDSPNPRGEIVARGVNIARGYFKNQAATDEVFLPGGWFATGDVGEMYPDGTLAVIDRKKNLVKLSSGEYIALERIEAVLKSSPFAENICIYGNSLKDFPVAIFVPIPKAVEDWAAKNGISGNFSELVKNEDLKKSILQSFVAVGRKEGLKSFEIPNNIHVTDDEWTPDNEMLTAAMKLKRRNIYDKYKSQIDKM